MIHSEIVRYEMCYFDCQGWKSACCAFREPTTSCNSDTTIEAPGTCSKNKIIKDTCKANARYITSLRDRQI